MQEEPEEANEVAGESLPLMKRARLSTNFQRFTRSSSLLAANRFYERILTS
jgi:hypothetical protein